MEARSTAEAAVHTIAAAEEGPNTAAEAVHMETAVAAVHKAAAAVSVDTLEASAAEAVDCQVVPEFSLNQDLVESDQEGDNAVSVVVERKARVEGRSD